MVFFSFFGSFGEQFGEQNLVHFRAHELIGEMSVCLSDKSFGRVAEPHFDHFAAAVLLTDSAERMAQYILTFIWENFMKNSVLICGRACVVRNVYIDSAGDRYTFVFGLTAFAFSVSSNDKTVFYSCGSDFARA